MEMARTVRWQQQTWRRPADGPICRYVGFLSFSIHWDAASRACSLFVCSSSGSGPLSISPPLIPHHGNLLAQVSLGFGNQRPPADDGGHRAAVGRGICLGDLQRSFLSFIVSLSLKRQWNAYVDRELLLTP